MNVPFKVIALRDIKVGLLDIKKGDICTVINFDPPITGELTKLWYEIECKRGLWDWVECEKFMELKQYRNSTIKEILR